MIFISPATTSDQKRPILNHLRKLLSVILAPVAMEFEASWFDGGDEKPILFG